MYHWMAELHIGERMNSLFKFYEVVKIGSKRDELKNLNGLEGTVLGMAKDENGNWSYSVHVDDIDVSYHLMEDEIVRTGRIRKKEDFYDGDSIRVRVNSVTGEGEVSD